MTQEMRELAANRFTNRCWSRTAGLTLIEMVVVITIVAAFSALSWQKLSDVVDDGKRTAAKAQIETLEAVLERYYIEHGRYPTTEEGLAAVDPFLKEPLGADPWGGDYEYEPDGPRGPQITSYGADGRPDGQGPAADIN